MAIRFSVHKTPQPNNRKGKQQTHARAVSYSTQKIKDLKSIRLKNVKSAPCYMPEERKTRLQDNLNHNESITTITYTKLNTCLRYQATADLKKHIKEELLCRIGSSTHVTYLLAKNDKQLPVYEKKNITTL